MVSFISKVRAKYDWEIDPSTIDKSDKNSGFYRNNPELPWIGFPKGYQDPKPIEPNEIWWHGRSRNDLKFEDRIAFFTDSRADAKFYTHHAGGILIKAQLRPKKVAGLKDMTDAVIKKGVTRKEIGEHSNDKSGDNFNDCLYILKVRKELMARGFDAVLVWDIMSNYEIRCVIVLNPKCIHVLGQEQDK